MDNRIRKNIRLKDYDYRKSGAYFITICTQGRQHFFWDYMCSVGGDAHIAPTQNNGVQVISTELPFELTDIGRIAEKYIVGIKGISKYVIMPNHIHMIIKINDDCKPFSDGGAMRASPPTQPLFQRIRAFKLLVTKEAGFSPWQRNYYEHIIRNKNEYREIWDYIQNNPISWEKDEYYTKE